MKNYNNASKSGDHTNPLQASFALPESPRVQKQFLNLFNDVEIDDDKKNTKGISSDRKFDENRITFDKLKIKLVRESQNIGEKDEQMSILKFSKSASQKNISPKQSGDDILVIKSDKKVINEDEEDTEEIKTLKEQIKRVEKSNERIKEENLQLRLKKVKLGSDSDTIQIHSLKIEIKQLKKKIQMLQNQKKAQLQKQSQQSYSHQSHSQSQQSQSEEDTESRQSRKKVYQYSSTANQYYQKNMVPSDPKVNFKPQQYEPYSTTMYCNKPKNDPCASFKTSFGSKNPNNFQDKSRHSNLSNFGVNHVKSTDKLTSPNEIFTPSTPTTNPVNPALNNHLFNSQFYVNSPKPVTNQFRYEVRNDGYKSPQPKKYIRK